MRKQAVFILAPHVKSPEKVFQMWALEGEEEQKGKLNNNLLDFKRKYEAEQIIKRKEEHYRKFLNKARLN